MLKRHEVGNLTQHSWSDNPVKLTVHPSKGPPLTMEHSCHDPSPPAVTPHASPKGGPEGRECPTLVLTGGRAPGAPSLSEGL